MLNFHLNRVTSFPDDIQEFTDLREAKFGRNPICGAVPAGFGELHRLTKFNCNFCCLNGTFPDLFGNMPDLQEAFWDGNNFSGPIPPSVGSLKSLTKISFNLNSLSGPVPDSLCKLSLLHDCRIGSDIDFGPYQASYPWLQQIGGNRFSCPLPSCIVNGVCNSSSSQPALSPVVCH